MVEDRPDLEARVLHLENVIAGLLQREAGREAEWALDNRRRTKTDEWALMLAIWAADQLRYPLNAHERELKEMAKEIRAERVEATGERFHPTTLNEMPRSRYWRPTVHPFRLRQRPNSNGHDPTPAA
jgi:hypothetical protein